MAVLAAGLLAVACEHAVVIPREHHAVRPASDPARLQRELEMNVQWQNRSFSELLGTRGAPEMVVKIPGGGNPPGFAIIYGVDPKTGCIDAFAVNIEAVPLVRVYYCR